MKLSEITLKGTLTYRHYYMQTMTDTKWVEHDIDCPENLKTIAERFPDTEVIVYGDDSLGIEINSKNWAVQLYDADMRPGAKLPSDVWFFIDVAMGRI